jgi:hypothetical protein
MGRIVELDHRNDVRILVADDEIDAHPVDPVMPRLEIMAFFHAEQLGELNLGQHDMLGQRPNQPKIKNLLRLRLGLRSQTSSPVPPLDFAFSISDKSACRERWLLVDEMLRNFIHKQNFLHPLHTQTCK